MQTNQEDLIQQIACTPVLRNCKKTPLRKLDIEIRPSNISGYGVFANELILPGEIIEECPLLMLTKDLNPELINYVFNWDPEHSAYALGYGSLYNHAENHNAEHVFDKDNELLTVKASKIIKTNEEIFIDYGEEWFKIRNYSPDKPTVKNKKNYQGLRLAFLGSIFFLILLSTNGLQKIYQIQHSNSNSTLSTNAESLAR
jgi:uncharacterized protein